MAGRVHLRVLGSFELTADGHAVALGGAKRRTLLALLVAHRGSPVSADRLVDELWGDAPPSRARDTLQAHLAHLRRALGGGGLIIERGPAGYTLVVEDPDDLDIRAFEVGAELGRAALTAGDLPAARAQFAAALVEWVGPPFEGVDDVPAVAAERTRLLQLHHGVVEDWAAASLDLGVEAVEVISTLERLLVEDPWRERATGQLMTALYRSGRQVDALAAYDRLRRGLAEELGLVPSPDLQALEHEILRQGETLGVRTAAVPTPAAAGPRVLPFVGRQAELVRLQRLVEGAAAGRRAVAVVSGEPGVGKTRLVRELAVAARAGGVAVLWGRGDDDPVAPYQPFVEALGPGVLDAQPTGARSGGRVRGTSSQFDRLRFFDSVVRMLAAQAPAVLVVDDAHAADAATWSLVHHVARTPVDLPLLLVLTCRGAAEGADRAMELLAEARQDDTVALDVRLDGLAEPEVAALVRAAAPAAAAEDVAPLSARLHESTGGNPFFVRELLGAAVDRAGSDRIAPGELDLDADLPVTVRDAIRSRFGRLGDDVLDMLRVAAVVGESFDLDLVAEVRGAGHSEVLPGVEAAVRAGVLVSTGVDRFRFAHGLLWRCVLDEVSPSRRVRVHQAVALALERLRGSDVEEHLPELAHHFAEAAGGTDAGRAVDYARRAGVQAYDLLAYEEAARHFRRALDGMSFTGSDDEPARLDVLLRLGDALNRSGHAAEATAPLTTAMGLAGRLGDRERLVAAALAYGGDLVEPGVSDRRQVQLLEEALAQLPTDALALRARVLAKLAEATEYERGGRCSALLAEAVEVARSSGDDEALAAALLADASIHVPRRVGTERLATATELAELAHARHDEELELLAESWRLVGYLETGDGEGFDKSCTAHAHRADELRQPLYQWGATGFQAMFAIVQGRFDEGEALAARAHEHGRRVFPMLALQNHAAQLLAIRWCQGRLAEVGDLVLDAARTSALPIWSAVPTWVRYHLGRREEAAAGLRAFLTDHHPDVLDDPYGVCCLALLAEVSAGCGDRATSSVVAAALDHLAAECVLVGRASVCLGAVDRYRALLASHLGELDEAVSRLEAAIEFDQRLGAGPFEVLARRDLAGALERRGAAGDARLAADHRSVAATAAAAFGMPAAS